MDDLDRLAEVVEAMTPGPWHGTILAGGHHVIGCRDGWVLSGESSCDDMADAHGLAALRNVAPELIAVAREARLHWHACDEGPGESRCSLCNASVALCAKFKEVRGG